MNNLPLIEKYRPTQFAEVVGVKDLSRLQSLISTPQDMPNMLFHGPAGVGKTTVAKIIVESLQPIDYIKINGSDTTGVDTIRDKVYNFMTSMSSEPNKPKLIWIEEFDYMSANAYAALRSMIEQYISNARFICTCNYINKLPEPIQSRFTPFEFDKPSNDEMATRLDFICKAENIKVEHSVLRDIILKAKGDIRTAINSVQQLSAGTNEIKVFDMARLSDLSGDVYTLLLNKEWTKIRYDIPNRNPDYNSLLVNLEELFFNSEIDTTKKATITELISTGLFEMSFSFDKNICFSAVCSRIIKEL